MSVQVMVILKRLLEDAGLSVEWDGTEDTRARVCLADAQDPTRFEVKVHAKKSLLPERVAKGYYTQYTDPAKFREESAQLSRQFMEDAQQYVEEQLGANSKRGSAVLELAWEDAHSDGFQAVYERINRLLGLF
jgi:hypothetical protein